jgi:hypothetical protein
MDTGTKVLLLGGLGVGAWWWFSQQTAAGAAAAAPAAAAPPQPVAPPIVVTPAGPPKMTITTSSGNQSVVNIGDTYTVSLTGYAPNAPVTVTAVQPGGAAFTAISAMTDANGNFVSSGSPTADHLGQWTETWIVNGQVAGTWSFNVGAGGPVLRTSGGPGAGVQGYRPQPFSLSSLRGLGAVRLPAPRLYVRSW